MRLDDPRGGQDHQHDEESDGQADADRERAGYAIEVLVVLHGPRHLAVRELRNAAAHRAGDVHVHISAEADLAAAGKLGGFPLALRFLDELDDRLRHDFPLYWRICSWTVAAIV